MDPDRADEPRRNNLALNLSHNSGIAECAGDAKPLEFYRARNRKFCTICMKRKTCWVLACEDWWMGAYRICWFCMDDDDRQLFREGY